MYMWYFLSNFKVCFSDLQALGNLLMHTCGYCERQEHGFEYKEEIHYTAVVYIESLACF